MSQYDVMQSQDDLESVMNFTGNESLQRQNDEA